MLNPNPHRRRNGRTVARVVVVDDDAQHLQALRQLLQQRGMEVHATDDSGAALALVDRVQPDLLVLDVHMPKPNGLDLCRAVLRGVQPAPAILFLSGDDSTAFLVEGLAAGAIDYVHKNTQATRLLAKVEAAARLGQRIRRLAQDAAEDPLTGLANRNALTQRGDQLVAVSQRHGRPLACILLDADEFKSVNDRYGHAAGDAVLVELARRLEQQCRHGDLVFRIGGEEFVVLTTETDASAAVQFADRLRLAIQRQPFEFRDQDGVPRREVITVSAGVAAWHAGLDLDQLVAEADQALYEAKRRGRNRVAVHAAGPSITERGA